MVFYSFFWFRRQWFFIRGGREFYSLVGISGGFGQEGVGMSWKVYVVYLGAFVCEEGSFFRNIFSGGSQEVVFLFRLGREGAVWFWMRFFRLGVFMLFGCCGIGKIFLSFGRQWFFFFGRCLIILEGESVWYLQKGVWRGGVQILYNFLEGSFFFKDFIFLLCVLRRGTGGRNIEQKENVC